MKNIQSMVPTSVNILGIGSGSMYVATQKEETTQGATRHWRRTLVVSNKRSMSNKSNSYKRMRWQRNTKIKTTLNEVVRFDKLCVVTLWRLRQWVKWDGSLNEVVKLALNEVVKLWECKYCKYHFPAKRNFWEKREMGSLDQTVPGSVCVVLTNEIWIQDHIFSVLRISGDGRGQNQHSHVVYGADTQGQLGFAYRSKCTCEIINYLLNTKLFLL